GTAPGSPRDIGGVSYWILDERGLATSVRQVLYGIGEPVRVEVLNGTAYGGMAAKAADILRKQGFSVVQVGNAEKQAQHTLIQGHGTSASIPDAVAGALAGIVRQPRLQILGAQEGSVSAAPDKGEVDVTVILGADAVPPQDQRTD
ncbi:MAG TPA: LytR C-terminal domain-containing protein, partial [Firmicutes bacterium]|nr:LytR C-terminal domain-containing protein [Bacillota bacterium]